jgi:hypothetical protein
MFVTMFYFRAGRIVTRGFGAAAVKVVDEQSFVTQIQARQRKPQSSRVDEDEWQSRFYSPRLAQANRVKIEKPGRHTSSQATDPAMSRAI